ncbi:MAG: hypothetical protein K8T10_03620 [Candidatus Eremiobacteraeota bacterium]|nr:hypothetical protein [Candidatus Eremiobacteraeota bacterium]
MDIRPTQSNQTETNQTPYKFHDNKQKNVDVHPDHYKVAAKIDVDKDHNLSDKEIKSYLRKEDILRDPAIAQTDEKLILRDYKRTLQNQPIEQTPSYHSYEELTNELHALVEKFPDTAELISLTKSSEGRDVWALKITKKPEPDPQDPENPENPGDGQTPPPQQPAEPGESRWILSDENNQNPPAQEPGQEPGQEPPDNGEPQEPRKPGILITGEHHAREWISLEVPLFAAKQILENYETDPKMKERVDKSVIWVVPLVNPDGYEYTRNESFWWRKNRQPITETACDIEEQPPGNLCNLPGGVGTSKRSDDEILGYGIDPNRNYVDDNPDNYNMYRPEGDTACSTWDDEGASDRISSSTYRGPAGGYAPEVKALMDLQESGQIDAAIDFHSYGRMILYPIGHSYDEHAENEEEYKQVAQNMSQIIHDADEEGVTYRPMKSTDLYPACGTSEDFQYANKILGFTVELARSYAPDEEDIEPIRKRLLGAQLYLIDYAINKPPEPEPEPQPIPQPQNPATS